MSVTELPEPREVLSVSQLNQNSRQLLEQNLGIVWVEGEISNLATPASGHWYFTLKDAGAQLRCAMFRNRNFRLRRRPENGQQLLVRGGISLYVARGEYQLIVEHLEDAGDGRLQREFEVLKAKLASEGLFDEARKQAMPMLPRHVAVITSPSGAAIHDFLTVFARRFPSTLITVLPSAVQGDAAAEGICAALELVNRHGSLMDPPVDAVVLTRGGGSLEDLWTFNTEMVARAIDASELPIVSAIGHETDFTISDMVADLRAPTPSAAAALLSPDRQTMQDALSTHYGKLLRTMSRRLDAERQRVNWQRRSLRHPASVLREQAQRIDDIEQALLRTLDSTLQHHRQRLITTGTKLQAMQPGNAIAARQQLLREFSSRARRAISSKLTAARHTLSAGSQLLDAVSPLATLGRGYAIVRDQHGQVLRSAGEISVGEPLTARLAQGSLSCRVEATHPKDSEPDGNSA